MTILLSNHKSDVRFVFTFQLFVGGLLSYLRCLCLFGHRGVQHVFVFLRFVHPMLPVFLDC